jgi:hypothetical protein
MEELFFFIRNYGGPNWKALYMKRKIPQQRALCCETEMRCEQMMMQ